MIAYEMQLRYVIRDKIQSEKKSEKKFFVGKYFVRKKIFARKNCLAHCLGFPVRKVSCLGQINADITKWYVHTAMTNSFISLHHSVNVDFCGHSRFVLWHENLTTFVS